MHYVWQTIQKVHKTFKIQHSQHYAKLHTKINRKHLQETHEPVLHFFS